MPESTKLYFKPGKRPLRVAIPVIKAVLPDRYKQVIAVRSTNQTESSACLGKLEERLGVIDKELQVEQVFGAAQAKV